jgi:predicted nucleic acid-binding protein
MAYLIDTDILSYVIHGIPEAEALLDELTVDGMAMSVITYLEALQSVTRSPIPGTARQRFDGLLSEMPVIQFGLLEAERTADLFEQLRQEGKRVRSRALDLLIAGTALTHDLTLVSNNADDYLDIPDLDFRAANIDVTRS